MKPKKPTSHGNSEYEEQQALRQLSVSQHSWRLHLLLPFSLLISLALFLALPIIMLILIDHPATDGLRTWIRWAGLPTSVSTLCIYYFVRRRLLQNAQLNKRSER